MRCYLYLDILVRSRVRVRCMKGKDYEHDAGKEGYTNRNEW